MSRLNNVTLRPIVPVPEEYSTLKINMDLAPGGSNLQTVAITSTQKNEGKSTTAIHLAVSYAEAGKKVLLVDADLRNPTLHEAFNKHNEVGLSNLLSSVCPLHACIQETHMDHLFLLKAGPVPSSPSSLLASQQMDQTLSDLKKQFDIVIIDAPSLEVIDAKVLAAKCDGVLLVLEYGRVTRVIAKKMKEELDRVKAQLVGIALNKARA